ncbi:MAG TPA: hypothetical protein PLA02_09165 [Brevefilum fermentans]|nr:hypothetical protein [Brevefilum fermentans]
MLRNSLKSVLGDTLSSILEDAGIDPRMRPEDLKLEDWIRLVEEVGS